MDKNIILPLIFHANLIWDIQALIHIYVYLYLPLTVLFPLTRTHFNFSATHNSGVTLYVDMNLFDLCPAPD